VTAYLDGPMVGFDTETTGIDVERDRIVTTCTVLLQPATPTWTQKVTSNLIAVDVDIPAAAEEVHGISTKFARENGDPAPVVLDAVADQLYRAMAARIPVVGSNLAYDFTILDRELRRHDLPTVDERLGRSLGPVIDVLVIDKWLDPYRKGKRKLTDLCEHYGIELVGAHDSTVDALAAARVAYRMGLLARTNYRERLAQPNPPMYPAFHRLGHTGVAARYRELAGFSMAELHDGQVVWRAEQCDSLRAHFDARGVAHDGVRGDWPMIPFALVPDGAV